ncbi:MAG: TRAM domain-containing protein, partial [Bacillota bacterium]|nr:TRAM domain-containing protein [Bacillota bacterium]
MEIDALGSNGEGIGRVNGYTVFVEGALPGEII